MSRRWRSAFFRRSRLAAYAAASGWLGLANDSRPSRSVELEKSRGAKRVAPRVDTPGESNESRRRPSMRSSCARSASSAPSPPAAAAAAVGIATPACTSSASVTARQGSPLGEASPLTYGPP